MIDYNNLYEKEKYYGAPYELLVNYFDRLEPKGTVLDIGCGQGRNAIFLSELGYQVTGIDISRTGLNLLQKEAARAKINITTIEEDVYQFTDFSSYDIILCDTFFRFLKKDLQKESALLIKILDELKIGGIFVNCMKNSARSMENFSQIFIDHSGTFDILLDHYAEYPEFDDLLHVFILKKLL